MTNARICSIEGCDNPFFAKGWCHKHYDRARKYGDPNFLKKGWSPRSKLLAFVEAALKAPEGDCVIWPFGRSRRGYAVMSRENGKQTFVHRIICERFRGKPSKPDLVVRHTCGKGTSGCISPHHLIWGTSKENGEDKVRHGTSSAGERNYRAVLTWDKVREIRSLKGIMPYQAIAEKFGVAYITIAKIQIFKLWKEDV